MSTTKEADLHLQLAISSAFAACDAAAALYAVLPQEQRFICPLIVSAAQSTIEPLHVIRTSHGLSSSQLRHLLEAASRSAQDISHPVSRLLEETSAAHAQKVVDAGVTTALEVFKTAFALDVELFTSFGDAPEAPATAPSPLKPQHQSTPGTTNPLIETAARDIAALRMALKDTQPPPGRAIVRYHSVGAEIAVERARTLSGDRLCHALTDAHHHLTHLPFEGFAPDLAATLAQAVASAAKALESLSAVSVEP